MTAYLHSLACDNAPCRCTVLYPVRETASVERAGAYNTDAGNEPELATIADGPDGVLIPHRSGPSAARGMRP